MNNSSVYVGLQNAAFLCINESVKLPDSMQFTSKHAMKIMCYTVLMVISFVGNISLFSILVRTLLHRRNRVHLLLLNMNIADLIVTCYQLPREIGHNLTVRWLGPDWLCKLCKFLDAFGVYLGSNVLVAITVDRFCFVMFPTYLACGADRKVSQALVCAWLLAVIASSPQLVLWKKAYHPRYCTYSQCVATSLTRDVPGYWDLINTVITALEVYLFPFCVICICYAFMFYKISATRLAPADAAAQLSDISDTVQPSPAFPNDALHTAEASGRQLMVVQKRQQASSSATINSRNFHMTAAMVVVFLICWTPYFAVTAVHFIDTDLESGRRKNNIRLNEYLTVTLYIIATFNSAANPYLCAYFSGKIRREISLLLRWFRQKCYRTNFVHKQSQSPHSDDDGYASSKDSITSSPKHQAVEEMQRVTPKPMKQRKLENNTYIATSCI